MQVKPRCAIQPGTFNQNTQVNCCFLFLSSRNDNRQTIIHFDLTHKQTNKTKKKEKIKIIENQLKWLV